MSALRLLAQDAEDLKVVSSALQDAVGTIGDLVYEAGARRLTVTVNRYRWEGEARERVRSALQIGSVLSVQARRLRRGAKSAVIELLAVDFEPGEAPGGRHSPEVCRGRGPEGGCGMRRCHSGRPVRGLADPA